MVISPKCEACTTAGWDLGIVLQLGQMHRGDSQIAGIACGFVQQAVSEPLSILAVLLSVSIVLYFPKHFPTHYHTTFSPPSLRGRKSSLLIKKVGFGEVHSARTITQSLDSKTKGPFHSVQLLL